jgi:hypothetical protein
MKKRKKMMESQRFLSLRESKTFYASVAKNVRRPTRSMLETQRVQVEIQTIKLKLSLRAAHPEVVHSMRVSRTTPTRL